MKLLHVCSGNLFGGVERVLLTLARERHLCPEITPYFAVCFAGQLSRELTGAGVPVLMLKEMQGRRPYSIIENRLTLRRFKAELKLDAVLFHSLWSYGLLGVGSKSRSVSNALWFHDAVQSLGPLERLARVQKPDVLISNSRYTAQSASKLYSGASPNVVHCPVPFAPVSNDAGKRREIRRSLKTSEHDVVIIQPSRMEAWKGHRFHLAALSQLRELPGWKLWIAGGAQRPAEQAYVAELKRQAAEGGIADRVLFLGHRNDVADLLASADIHCQPNEGPEPFGISFIEGMMAGLPIVTVRIGAALEIIDETCGLLSSPGNISELALNLRTLIADKDLRRRLGRNGPNRAKELCDPRARLNDLYQCLQNQGAKEPAVFQPRLLNSEALERKLP